ncbi:MAG: penicillin amidase, partial [Alteromonadaceae bacterium]
PHNLPSVELEGIKKPFTLSRDAKGIVKINAATDEDAFFALGYAHAQDRLWQLEIQKRTSQGRLSEVFGKESVSIDIWFRTLGLYHSAKKAWSALTPQAQSSLTSYAAGINAWLDNTTVLPPEFTLLGIEPEHWHVNDSLAYIKLFALNLSGNFRQEISRMLATKMLNSQQLATVFDTYPADAPTTVSGLTPSVTETSTLDEPQLSQQQVSQFADLLALQQSIQSKLKIGGRFVGSNGWVVAPKHSKNAQALLANDPHLGLQIPSLWYAASLQGQHLNVSGMSLVGLPLVVFGRNQHISWGGTAMMTDNQDLYFERVNENDTSLYLADGQWVPFEERVETLGVRADFPAFLRQKLQPIEIKIRSTRHGPVISDIFDVFDHPVALQWTALIDKDTTYESFFKLNYATNWADFKHAVSHQVAPSLNMLYADKQGNIGYVGAGQIPLRNKGNGELPVSGWNEENRWRGVVPPAQWPQVYNPPQGYIVSANNKVVGDDYPYFISQDWAPGARASRITELLQNKIDSAANQSGPLLTIADMGEIQADTLSLPAKKLLPQLTAVIAQDSRQQEALDLLQAWDGDMQRHSQAASLYLVWSRFLSKALFDDELKVQWGKTAQAGFLDGLTSSVSVDNVVKVLLKQNGEHDWCDNTSTAPVESCAAILLQSLDQSIDRLSKLSGSDPQDWEWGDIHHTAYDHRPFSSIKLLDQIFARKIGNGGGNNTVNVSGAAYDPADGYRQTFGAAFRQIISMGEQQTTHLLMNSTGQSGNVLSKHYDDMVVPFRDVSFINIDADPQQSTSFIPATNGQESKP